MTTAKTHTTSEFATVGNYIVEVAQPHIERDFYIGYGYSGLSTQEEARDAFRYADKLQRDTEAFKAANFKKFDDLTDKLKRGDYVIELSRAAGHECTNPTHKPLTLAILDPRGWVLTCCRSYEDFEARFYQLTTKDKRQLIAAIGRAKQRLNKRLDNYIKRYGLSKVCAHVFLSD